MANPALQTVADAAGVSVPTASLILNGKGDRYAPATVTRVRAAAKRLGYRPGAAAVATARGRQGAVCLLRAADVRESHLPADLLDGIESALLTHDHHLVVARAVSDAEPKWLRQVLADGFIVASQESLPARTERLLAACGQPAVWLNVDRDQDCVRPDDEAAGYDATRMLLDLGHRRIAAADHGLARGQVSSHYSQNARLAGYRRAMAEAGVPAHVLQVERPLHGADRLAVAMRWLATPTRPTAIVAWTNNAAGSCIAAALARGWSVPRDLSVVTIHERQLYECGLPMTAMVLPWRSIGQRAVEALLARLSGAAAAPAIIIPTDLMPGATHAPPSEIP